MRRKCPVHIHENLVKSLEGNGKIIYICLIGRTSYSYDIETDVFKSLGGYDWSSNCLPKRLYVK